MAPSKRPPPRRPALVTAQDSKHDSENEDKAAHLLETTSVVSLLSDEECTVPHVARRDAESGSDEDSKVPITAHVCPRKETVTHQGLLQGEASSNTSPAVLHGIGDHMAAAGAVEAGHQGIVSALLFSSNLYITLPLETVGGRVPGFSCSTTVLLSNHLSNTSTRRILTLRTLCLICGSSLPEGSLRSLIPNVYWVSYW